MDYGMLLIVLLLLLLVGAIPNWGWNSGFGYWPSGVVAAMLVVALVLLVKGKL